MPGPHLEYAHAKLTLSLKVVGRKSDGYHLLEAEMASVDLCDEVVIEQGRGLTVIDQVQWRGPDGPGVLDLDHGVPLDQTNLVTRALNLARREAAIQLTKRIPPGSGLGGGSSDAAAVLRWCGMTDTLRASTLGADVPFCLAGGHAIARGIGEILEPLDFEDRTFLLVTPRTAVSTKSVFEAFDALEESQSEMVANDLERAALVVEPRLALFRDIVMDATGIKPVLAGSGSTYFVECCEEDAERHLGTLTNTLEACCLSAAVTIARTVDPLELRKASASL